MRRLHMLARIVIAALSAMAAAPLAAQATPASLVGTWRLVSLEVRDSAGGVSHPMGDAAAGHLIYDASGQTSAHLMRPDRPRFASGDRARGTDAETRAAFVGYLAYFGRYTVDPARGTVTHFIEGATFPNWVGTEQVRHFRLSGDSLTIVTPPMVGDGRRIVSTLVWRRVTR